MTVIGYGDNGKENGNYSNGLLYLDMGITEEKMEIIGHGDNGKENGKYYHGPLNPTP